MKTLDTYIGIEPFTVLVDDSPQLGSLVEQARQLRTLPFAERLEAVKHFALEAMVNAYEQMIVWGHKKTEEEGVKRLVQEADITDDMEVEKIDGPMIKGWRDVTALNEAQRQHQRFYDIVFQHHPLSYALEQKAGCCRYQGALFFVLGYLKYKKDSNYPEAYDYFEKFLSKANNKYDFLIEKAKSYKVELEQKMKI